MATLYDVLGVDPHASPEAVRRAYLERARALHPDRAAGRPAAEAATSARRMQDVNEAWRVLRDPERRAAYDRSLVPAAPAPLVDDLDRVYPTPLAEPGDLGVSVVRALPWVAVVVVLGVIFVFTAFAAGGGDGGRDGAERLEGRCVSTAAPGTVRAVPCDGAADGRVVLVADRASHCPPGTASRPYAGSRFLCLDRSGR